MAEKQTRQQRKAHLRRTNKKHLARIEVERRQRRIVMGVTIAVVIFVIGVLGYAWLNETYFKKNKPVAIVNGDKITLNDFQARVRMERQRIINQYNQYLFYGKMMGLDPKTDPNLAPQLQQIAQYLGTPLVVGQNVLDTMIDERLIMQAAADMGVTVTDEEVEQNIQENFGFFPDGTPTPTATAEPMVYSTLSPTQLALVTLTPTPEPIPTATSVPTATPDPNLTPTVTPFPSPTATPYTAEGFQEEYQNTLKVYEPLGFDEALFRSLFEFSVIRQKVYDVVTADTPREEEQVWARHILVADEDTAKEVLQRLQDGEDFGALAQEYSQDPGSAAHGGDLGWFGRGRMVQPFEETAFSLDVGEISQPVQTQYGWHIIQVLGHEDRPLTEDQYKRAKDKVFSDWVASLHEGADIQTFPELWQNNVPTDPTLQ